MVCRQFWTPNGALMLVSRHPSWIRHAETIGVVEQLVEHLKISRGNQ